MTEISFYILNQASLESRLTYACRLAEKAYQKRMSVLIHCSNETEAHSIDDMLWNQKPERFLPHSLVSENVPDCPIQIGYQMDQSAHQDILINLANDAPDFFSQFKRHFEVLCQTADVLESGRSKWRFFSDRGYALKKFDIAL